MKAHLIGGGIASLAAAAYLIKDGGLLGPNITIHEAGSSFGGALDASGGPGEGYFMRGGRMFEEKYLCTRELLSFIPSVTDPHVSVSADIADFYETSSWDDKARLVGADGKVIDAGQFQLTARHRLDLAAMALAPEGQFGMKTIGECFDATFFTTNFWFMFATIFAFRPGHSAMEMRRYLHRFFHLLPTMASMRAVQRTRFNQYESIVKPVTAWLSGLGVDMRTGSRVSDIGFAPTQGEITATRLVLERGGAREEVKIGNGDLVFFTNGSLVDGSARGSMTRPPEPITAERDGGFALWQSLARTRSGFGRPEAFTADVTTSGWISFTITVRDLALMQKLEIHSGRKAGRGGLMTLTASNWLVTLAPLHHPHFIGQPEDVSVIWGYGLFPEKSGSFVNKPMTRCTGAELLEEILRHLGLDDDLHRVLGNSTCIPCFMPYAGSIFMPRQHGDRPAPVPRGSTNFAFIGQYCELPDDVVFTVEYSVRSGRTAAAALLGFKPPPPVYKGEHDPATVVATLKALSS